MPDQVIREAAQSFQNGGHFSHFFSQAFWTRQVKVFTEANTEPHFEFTFKTVTFVLPESCTSSSLQLSVCFAKAGAAGVYEVYPVSAERNLLESIYSGLVYAEMGGNLEDPKLPAYIDPWIAKNFAKLSDTVINERLLEIHKQNSQLLILGASDAKDPQKARKIFVPWFRLIKDEADFILKKSAPQKPSAPAHPPAEQV